MSQRTESMTALHAAHQARFAGAGDSGPPLDYGDFPGEVEALHASLGVVSLDRGGVILLRGEDAAEFLGGITTNNVKALAPGGIQSSLLCANKGKILHPIEVVRTKPDQLLVLTEPDALDDVAGHLNAYLIREAVEIGQVPLMRIDLIGPGGNRALEALGYSAQSPLGAFQEAPLLTLAHPLGTAPRVVTLLPAGFAPRWVETLLSSSVQARLAGLEAHDEVRIAAGAPRFGVDYGREHLPAEAALIDRLSFDKGCYVGQEIHARLHYRGQVNRKLVGLEIPESMAGDLGTGSELFAGETISDAMADTVADTVANTVADTVVGTVTSLARLPREGVRRGIAMVRQEQAFGMKNLCPASGAPPAIKLHPLASDLGAASS